MKKNTLEIIQTIARVAGIVTKVLYICCIVGAICCLVGIISLALIPGDIKLGGVTIKGLISENTGGSMGSIYNAMATGIVFCIGEAILCKYAESYFRHELEAGTPFTFGGAKEMLRLGVLTICLPIAMSIAAGIVYLAMRVCFGSVGGTDLNNSASIGVGLMLIVVSLICRYGAELNQKDTEEN